MDETTPQPRPILLFLTAILAIVAGGTLGAITNAVNGLVSSTYFVTIMHWYDVENVWRAAIAQGILEGLIYGFVFAFIYTLVIGLVTKARANLGFAIRPLLLSMGIALVCWCIGGVLAAALAALSPEFYRRTFIGVPSEFNEMLKYAWVGGSIWGAMFGAVLAVVIACLMAAANWRRQEVISPLRGFEVSIPSSPQIGS